MTSLPLRSRVDEVRARVMAGGWPGFLLVALVVIPMLFNAIALRTEVTEPIPSINDNMFHWMMIRSASEAIAEGSHPLDSWGPEMDLGVPRLLHYQILPAFFVIGLDYLTLGMVGLLPLFNLTRYLLLVLLPLTVYWSMRRMEFSRPAAAGGAAVSSLISANGLYGMEYDSYIWRGWGMYTQQWAIHLSFMLIATLWRLGRTGQGFTMAVVGASLLVLSHLLYAEMMVVTGLIVFLCAVDRDAWRQRLGQFALAGLLVAMITSFLWFTYLQQYAYVGESPYDSPWKLDSFGARTILEWLVSGELFDHNRAPVVTALLGMGLVVALWIRRRLHLFSLALFGVWLVLYFGRSLWGPATDYIPSGSMLLFHRFIGSFHIASVLLIGLGFAWIWDRCSALSIRAAIPATVALCVILLAPAIAERHGFYADNARWMRDTSLVYSEDVELRSIIETLRALPESRVYAGLRDNWGEQMGIPSVPWYRILVFEGFDVVSVPLPSINLHSDLMFHFDDQNPMFYDLFDVRYVLAPRAVQLPSFLTTLTETPQYALYRVPDSSAATFAVSTVEQSAASKLDLFIANRTWLLGAEPAQGHFIRWDYPSEITGTPHSPATRCANGSILREELERERLAFRVACDTPSTLIIKTTYHPHWRVMVDGVEVEPFMASPSFIGVDVPPGTHDVVAVYRTSATRNALLAAGLMTCVGLMVVRRHVDFLR